MITTEAVTKIVCDVCQKQVKAPFTKGSFIFGRGRDVNYTFNFYVSVDIDATGETCICQVCAEELLRKWLNE